MRLEISDSVNGKTWDATVSSLGGKIFHSAIWAEYSIAGSQNTKTQYITLCTDDGEVLGAALAFFLDHQESYSRI